MLDVLRSVPYWVWLILTVFVVLLIVRLNRPYVEVQGDRIFNQLSSMDRNLREMIALLRSMKEALSRVEMTMDQLGSNVEELCTELERLTVEFDWRTEGKATATFASVMHPQKSGPT
jgi:hypothetical protein